MGEIDIMAYQYWYWYVMCKGGNFGTVGMSRSPVVFLNTNLSILEMTRVSKSHGLTVVRPCKKILTQRKILIFAGAN